MSIPSGNQFMLLEIKDIVLVCETVAMYMIKDLYVLCGDIVDLYIKAIS